MIQRIAATRVLYALVLVAYFLGFPAASFAAGGGNFSLLDTPGGGPDNYIAHDREYFSTNRENRFLIKVHVWGDVWLSGIHNVPDNSTLLDVLGFAGGPTGYLADSNITVTRAGMDKAKPKERERDPYPQTVKFEAKELVTNSSYRNMPLKDGDVIYLEAPPKVDTLSRNLTIVATVFSILATAGAVYLIAKQPNH
jgi:hypothetical protein